MIKPLFIALVIAGVACGAGTALAHDEGPDLPSAGLTPSNFFYFLDRLGEIIQEVFTFGAENKSFLQLEFAAERVAEISLEREIKGEASPGLEVAKSRLSEHLKESEAILNEAEIAGEDVGEARSEKIELLNDIYEESDWLDDFMEESDDIDEGLGIPDEGEIDEDFLKEIEELESRL